MPASMIPVIVVVMMRRVMVIVVVMVVTVITIALLLLLLLLLLLGLVAVLLGCVLTRHEDARAEIGARALHRGE